MQLQPTRDPLARRGAGTPGGRGSPRPRGGPHRAVSTGALSRSGH